MRRTRSLGLVAAAGIVTLAPAALAGPAQASAQASASAEPRPRPIAVSTRTDLLEAMHGEARARASYLAFSAQARREGNHTVARLFADTAGEELSDHFTLEAGYVRLVGSNEANLTGAVNGEDYEAKTMYPGFEKQARAQGDTRAAELFHEIAADEAAHRDLFQQALRALQGQGRMPDPPSVDVVEVPAGPARSKGKTLENLEAAMGGESFASAKYLAYAAHARKTGEPELAALLTTLSDIELKEHFNAEAELAGLVGSSRDNLAAAASGENDEATKMYPAFAKKAKAAGDQDVARTLLEIAGDEASHRDAFLRARRAIHSHHH
jgi:rubrerythrin